MFRPLNLESVSENLLREDAHGILLQFGGQTAINLALPSQIVFLICHQWVLISLWKEQLRRQLTKQVIERDSSHLLKEII